MHLEGITFSLWCFSPGVAMKALKRLGVRSMLLTSGTLSPMKSFATSMQVPFPIQLSNGHVVRENQVWISSVNEGPTRHILNSTYHKRDTPAYKRELGRCVSNFARIVPSGMLSFFSIIIQRDASLPAVLEGR